MNKTRLLERFLKYVRCSSESGSEREFCLLLEEELKAMGVAPRRDECGQAAGSNGWNVCAYIPGEGEPLLLCSHLDTVKPGLDIKPVIKDGVIRSSGDTVLGSDDKSGIAEIMEAVQSLLESGTKHRPIELMFTVCEEVGLCGSKNADYSRLVSRRALVLDSSKCGCVINRAPTELGINVTITGKPAHAACSPELGINALSAAAEAISGLPIGRPDDMTVMNAANLIAPGPTNVVCPKAAFDMDIRCFEEELLQKHVKNTEETIKRACDKYGASYTFDVHKKADALYVPPESELIAEVKAACERAGRKLEMESTFGLCDAVWLHGLGGIEALDMGSGMQSVHGVDEYIEISELEGVCEILQDILTI